MSLISMAEFKKNAEIIYCYDISKLCIVANIGSFTTDSNIHVTFVGM